MKPNLTPHWRSNEILRLLLTHNALTVKTIQSLLSAPISRRRLRDVLERMTKDGLVTRRKFGAIQVPIGFYEIAEPHRSNANIPTIHSSHLIHNDLCSLAHAALVTQYPSARIYREHAIPREETLRKIMLYQPGAKDSLPDILMVIPTLESRRNVYIAVEIERSDKGAKRLFRKFAKYAIRTKLDGVLYLSESEPLLESFRTFYQSRVSPTARRVGHYRDHFFMSAACPERSKLRIESIHSSANRSVSLTEWIDQLIGTPLAQRRDLAFNEPTSCGVANGLPETNAKQPSIQEDGRHHPPIPSPSSLPNPSPPTSV